LIGSVPAAEAFMPFFLLAGPVAGAATTASSLELSSKEDESDDESDTTRLLGAVAGAAGAGFTTYTPRKVQAFKINFIS
jgi:hypothetical protein